MKGVSGSSSDRFCCFSFFVHAAFISLGSSCSVSSREVIQTRATVARLGRPSAGGRLAACALGRAPRRQPVRAARPSASRSPMPIAGARSDTPLRQNPKSGTTLRVGHGRAVFASRGFSRQLSQAHSGHAPCSGQTSVRSSPAPLGLQHAAKPNQSVEATPSGKLRLPTVAPHLQR